MIQTFPRHFRTSPMMSSPPATPPAQAPACRNEERFEETGDPCEWSEDYRPGGFHPVNLGDTFNDGRYRVIRKLGYGSFSTVWLVVDNENACYRALKVVMAKQSSSGDTEIGIGSHLTELASSNVSQSKHVALALNNFKHVGPNGTHLCLVYQPMGGTVASMVEKLPENQNVNSRRGERPRYSLWMSKRILKHVLSGLAFLHQNGVIHGDIQSGNFLFCTSNLDLLKEEELKQSESTSLHHFEDMMRKQTDGHPGILCSRNHFTNMQISGLRCLSKFQISEQVRILWITSDFIRVNIYEAFWSSNPPKKTVTPVALRAPELIFDEPFSSAIDIWSFGCLIYELLTGLKLFGVWLIGDDSQEEADDDHLMELNDILEPLPDSWLGKWPRSHLYFGPNRERLNPRAEEDIDIDIGDDYDDEQNAEHLKTLEGESDNENGGVTPIDGDHDDCDDFPAVNDPNPDLEDDGPFINEHLGVLFEKNKPEDVSTAEAQVVTSLIRQILRYDPSDRPTATQLLGHEWFKD